LVRDCWVFNIGKFDVKTYLVYSRKERAKKVRILQNILQERKELSVENIAEY
jgi:hypothetical protein